MRILITGAAGFIGSSLADTFIADGHDVAGVDDFTTGREENVNPALVFQRMDITDMGAQIVLCRDFPTADVVVHCAASYSDPDAWERDADTNVLGGIDAARLAKELNAHLVYFQTILPPVSSYAISKIAAEQYMRLSGVDLTVLRLANIYGPRNLSGPIPAFYKRLTSGQPCVVVDTTREMVFISDLVRCVKEVVEKRLTGTYDVCTGKQTSIMELFSLVAREVDSNEVPPLIPPDPDDVQGHVYPYRGIPGWKAEVSLRDGISRTVESYRASGIEQTYTHLRIGEKDAS